MPSKLTSCFTHSLQVFQVFLPLSLPFTLTTFQQSTTNHPHSYAPDVHEPSQYVTLHYICHILNSQDIVNKCSIFQTIQTIHSTFLPICHQFQSIHKSDWFRCILSRIFRTTQKSSKISDGSALPNSIGSKLILPFCDTDFQCFSFM